MEQRKIILTGQLPENSMKKLERMFKVVMVTESDQDIVQLLRRHPDTEGMISMLYHKIGRSVIDSGKNLKIIANYAVGYNNMDVAYAIKKNIYLTHTPDVLTESTADLAMALVLGVARRLGEADRLVRKGKFDGWRADLMLGKDIAGTCMAIAGMGRIGQATARRAAALGMKVIYFSRTRRPDLERSLGYEYMDFPELVRRADVLSFHLAYSDELHHMLNRDMLASMKKDAIVINVARGQLIDEAALAEFLADSRLFGAGLDVYEREPDIHPDLLKLDNVLLMPHIGSATRETREKMADMAANCVRQCLNGGIPDHLVPEWRQALA